MRIPSPGLKIPAFDFSLFAHSWWPLFVSIIQKVMNCASPFPFKISISSPICSKSPTLALTITASALFMKPPAGTSSISRSRDILTLVLRSTFNATNASWFFLDIGPGNRTILCYQDNSKSGSTKATNHLIYITLYAQMTSKVDEWCSISKKGHVCSLCCFSRFCLILATTIQWNTTIPYLQLPLSDTHTATSTMCTDQHHTVQVARVQVKYVHQWLNENTTSTSYNWWQPPHVEVECLRLMIYR